MATPCIDDLPEEVLEFILSLISPYKDLHDCMTVSKKWKRCVINVVKTKQRNLYKSIIDFDVKWEKVCPNEGTPTISKRYSHTAAVHENSMYVFGGCTSAMTTFNDLWRLDLSTRVWVRPLAMGTYPSPKACSSLIRYKDTLILFGGWAYPSTYPLYQSWHLFNELHVYDIIASRWECISTLNAPPPVAGHSVSIINDWMIIFGGLQKPCTAVHCEKSNDIWKLNLSSWTWYKQEVENGPKPSGRFGQTQVVLNDENILILGGSGGPSFYNCDAWILNISGAVWKWIQVDILEKPNQPTNIWSNPGCKIGDKIVVLNRIRQPESNNGISYYPKSAWAITQNEDGRTARIDLANRQTDRDENVNGKRGTLQKKRVIPDIELNNEIPANAVTTQPRPSPSGSRLGPAIQKAEYERRKEIRLEKLRRIEERLDNKNVYKREKKTHYLGIYVLDISEILNGNPKATWLPPKNVMSGPEETILYTLVEGKSELIMFGGIQNDANSLGFSMNFNSQTSNSLHFISAPNYVI